MVDNSQDAKDSLEWLKLSAELGNADSQNRLGFEYWRGRDVPLNDAEAIKWYRKSAEQGHAEGQFNLGVMYKTGRGVPQDDTVAVKWFRKAAEQGDEDAQDALGKCYSKGLGVPQDYIEALKWTRMSAEQGCAPGQFFLGLTYVLGLGVAEDYMEAVKWFRKAAEQGDEEAQNLLENLLELKHTKNINVDNGIDELEDICEDQNQDNNLSPDDKKSITEKVKKEITEIEHRTDLTDDQKVSQITHIACATCAGIAVQPIPFADIFILTPIQGYFGTRIAAIRGVPVSENEVNDQIKEIVGIIGMGFIAQQLAIGIWKMVTFGVGGLLTIPLVYALSYAIMKVIDAYYSAKAKRQRLSNDQIKNIWKSAFHEGKKKGEENQK